MRTDKKLTQFGNVSTEPNLEDLAAALRNMPPEFSWNYCSADHCAIGVANRMWNTSCESVGLAKDFDIDPGDVWEIFYGVRPPITLRTLFGGKHRRMMDVTPEHVANAIDNVLRARKLT